MREQWRRRASIRSLAYWWILVRASSRLRFRPSREYILYSSCPCTYLVLLSPGRPNTALSRCQNRNARPQWDILNGAKARILNFVWTTQPVAAGVRLAAIKFMQRVILVQTRGVADPRVRLSRMLCYVHRALNICISVHSFRTRTTPTCPCAPWTTRISPSAS